MKRKDKTRREYVRQKNEKVNTRTKLSKRKPGGDVKRHTHTKTDTRDIHDTQPLPDIKRKDAVHTREEEKKDGQELLE